jgi:hypothetical protein
MDPSMFRSAMEIGLGDLAGESAPLEGMPSSTSARVVWEENIILSCIGNDVGVMSTKDLTAGACGEHETEWFGDVSNGESYPLPSGEFCRSYLNSLTMVGSR